MQVTFTEQDLQKGTVGYIALKTLLEVMGGTDEPSATTADPAVVQVQPQAVPMTPVATMPQPVPSAAVSAPIATQVPEPVAVPQPVPVSAAPAYTHDQIAQAAAVFAEVSDTNRQQVLNLINKYGASCLTGIPAERLGEVATELRGMGARI